MSVHTHKSFVQIEWNKDGLDVCKVLTIVHSIVELILKSVEVTDGPFDLEPETFSLLIVLMFL
jgi:hypothetical protein